MGKKHKMKKLLAYVMTLMMIFNSLPASAFAISERSERVQSQIGDYYEVNDETGEIPANPTLPAGRTEQAYESGNVKMNKTIEATGSENEFKITLTAETTEVIEEIEYKPDSALVIVFDVSNSMHACNSCQHLHGSSNNGYTGKCGTCNCSNDTLTAAKKRFNAAWEATQAVINRYADDSDGAYRKIAIVKFSGYKNNTAVDGAKTVVSWSDADDLNTANSNTINSVISDNLKPDGGTNLQAGLLLADNLLKDENVPVGKNGKPIMNKSVIIISDGAPTYYISSNTEANSTSTDVICEDSKGLDGTGNSSSHTSHTKAEEQAALLKSHGVDVFAAYVGTEKVNCVSDTNQNNECDVDLSGEKWLEEKCGFTTKSANSAEELVSALETFMAIIESNNQAWQVEDPMGEHNDYTGADRGTVKPGEFTETDDVLSWNLKEANANTNTEGNTTYYTYALSYNIKLNNLAENFPEGFIPANGVTDLNYVVTNSLNGEQISYKEATGYFNIPSVKGLTGEYEFFKLDDNGDAVRDAVFELAHTCATCDNCKDDPCSSCEAGSGECEKTVPEEIATATSDASGKVKFADIPSGHTYKLTEKTAPSGYVGTANEYTMTVDYGNVTVNGYPEGLTVVNKKIPMVDVEGGKTWVDNGGIRGNFTVSLYGEYEEDGKTYYLTKTNNGSLKSQTNKVAYGNSNKATWSWTNLPGEYNSNVVDWYIVETTVPSGYTPVIDGWNVTNILETEDDYIGQKIWAGDEESDRPDPENMDIALYKLVNGQEVQVHKDIEWVETEGGTWIFKFSDIEKYDADGKVIQYFAKERTVPAGYVHDQNDDVVQYPEKGDLTARTDYTIPSSSNNSGTYSFNFSAGEVGLIVAAKANTWNQQIHYSIWTSRALTDLEKAAVVNNAKSQYSEITLNNTEFLAGNQAVFYRNDSTSRTATVSLTGTTTGTVKFDNASVSRVWNSWRYGSIEFVELYTPGTTTITNEIKTEDVTVKKSWNDNNNEAGVRPESIVVTLTGTVGTGNSAETIVTEEVTLSESNNWEYTWTGLRDYKNGKDVVYTVKEKEISNYYVSSEPIMNGDGDYVITNTFIPDPTVPVEISGNKTLTGRLMKNSDSFTFNIEGADDATRAAITAGEITGVKPVTINGTNGAADKAFTFSGITFKKAGEYKFNITEVNGSIPGVEYDDSVVTVTVDVAYSKADNRLVATIVYPGNSGVQFTNEYNATPAEITLEVSKTLKGRDWINADEFTFELKALKNGNAESIELPDPVTITKATDEYKATFGKLVFDKAGTYKFVVTETAKSGNGINYDESEKIVTIVVKDNENGQLTAVVDADQSDVLAFTNIYDAADITVQLEGTKQLEGATLKAGDYEFQITALTENAPMPASAKVTNAANGTINFGDIVFSKAGTYEYEITEVSGRDDNVKYDSGTVKATIVVTEDEAKGELSANVKYRKNNGEESDSFTFRNEYIADAEPISLTAKKSLGGVKYGGTPEFTFVLTPAESNASTDPISSPVEVKLNGEGTVKLVDKVTYTEPGTYVYTVSERQGSILNMTYDTQPVEITVVVTENKTTHKLDTEVIYKKNGKDVEGVAFSNTYSPEGTDAVIGGFKTVSGNKQLDTEKFKFTIEAVTPGAPLPEVSTVENNNAGEFQFQFGKIEYTAPGVYEYQVREVAKADSSEMPGYTYDDNVYTVIVTITDNNGKLVSSVEYKDDGETVDGMYFDNEYKPETVNASVAGFKAMRGRDLKDGESYEFRITAINGAPLPEKTIAVSGNGGAFEFGDITFEKAGRYEYSITEIDGNTPGVEYSKEVYKAVIVVSDNTAEGKLVVDSVKYYAKDKEVKEVVFTNEYQAAPVKVALKGDKTLNGRAMAQGESFEFTMEAVDGITKTAIENGIVKDFNGTASVSGGDEGEAVAFDFGEMIFTAAGEYKFTIVENIPDETNGITYDRSEYEVVVTVTDDENGHLQAAVSYGEGNRLASFVNEYAAEGTTAQINATKQLRNAELAKGQFEFVLTDEDGKSVTAVNDADGNVVFDLEFDEAGTYEYTLSEKAGADKNFAYDNAEYKIIVNVTDDGKGQLIASVIYPNGETPEFVNTYKTISISAKKVWDDADNQDGKRPDSITFNLMNGDKVIDSKELKNGTLEVAFNGLPEFDEEGNAINYTVEEILPEDTEYTSVVEGSVDEGFVVTNKYIPETTNVSVKKVWNDKNDQDGKRPETLEVTLSNGDKVILSEENDWTATITDLPKYAGGQLIEYTWLEEKINEKYSAEYATEGTVTTITNTYPVETTEVTVKKIWNDADNQDGKRPENLTVTLSNGQKVTLNEENGWTATVTNLDKYENKGQLIEYTWTEDESGLPEGYKLTDTSADGKVTTLTNSYTPETTEATVKKVWDDAENQDGKRPEELKVTLSNGTEVTLNEENNWEVTVTGLPKYADGEEIEYTWSEGDMPEGYTLTDTSEDGAITTLTNSYTPEETSATVKKVWDDAENQDGKRPESLTVTLSNGTEVTLNEENNWKATVTDLPKYADGKLVEYTWTEGDMPEGYELTDTSVEGTVTTLTNSHTPEETEATVKKVWDDAENQDGKRPESLTVTLSNGAEVTLNADNNWEATVTGLPKYANGEKIKYTWSEGNVSADYTLTETSVDGTITTLTNTHTPELVSSEITKKWDDSDDQDGKRPDELKVQLYANGNEYGDEITLTEANGWNAIVENLPKYANGKEIVYTWTEDTSGFEEIDYGLTDYTSKVEKNGTSTVITNTHPVEVTSSTVKKVWDDVENQDGKRPDYLRVKLNNGQEVTLNEDNNWTVTINNLAKYKDGEEIVYTWSEVEVPEGYTLTKSEANGTEYTLTNTHTPEKTSATVKKVWDDAENQDGKRPESLTVTLSNGTEVELTASNGWTATVDNLPKYADGKLIEYTWTEGDMPDGYKLTNTSVNGTITTLTNSRTPELTEATVKKVWDDAENQDGKRPESITVTLSNGKEVTLNEGNNWTETVTDLPKYNAGEEIVYTWTEKDMPEGYTLADTSADGTITTLTNSYEPEKTSATVVKVWDDTENQDGKRPESLTAILSNGTEVTLNADNGWTAVVTDLPKYNAGEEIVYTWTEGDMPEGYELTETRVEGTVTTLTNSHVPELTEATVKKVWDDAENQDGKRPESITVTLSDGTEVTLNADNNWTETVTDLPKYEAGTEIVYTWTEGDMPEGYELTDTRVDGTITTLTNSRAPETTEATVKKVWDDAENQDGKRPESLTVKLSNGTEVTLNADNNWEATVTDLPKYNAGEEIVYTWTEGDMPEDYELADTSVNGTVTTLKNSYAPEIIDIEGKKIWDDAGNQDGKRPDAITVTLYADNEVVESRTVTEADGWKWKFTDLPRYKSGVEINYTIEEPEVADGYVAEVNDYDITNSYTPEETEISVTKVWNDADNQDGIRPESVTVELLADGTSTDRTLVLDEENNWTSSFTGLDKFRDGGVEIEYTVEEIDAPEGYEVSVAGDAKTGFTVTNTHKTETVEISGTKTWNDADNQDGKRPESITVNLYADGDKVASQTVTAPESGDENEWYYVFNADDDGNALPKYKSGKEIVYTVTEDEVDEYTTAVDQYDITNSHTPETVDVSGSKVWDDNDNQDGVRPEGIVITLLVNGSPVEGKTVEVTEADEWTWTFTDLPKYAEGEEIVYTFSEEAVDNYSTTYSDGEVINTHTPDQTSVTVSKAWNDDNNRDGIRPESVTVELLADGMPTDITLVLDEGNNWISSFTELDKYRDGGEEIVYTVEEIDVPEGYEVAVTGDAKAGFTVTNTHTPETVKISGTKTWYDADNQDGKRPDEITINLLANGEEIKQAVVSEEKGWAWTFEDLYKYENGAEIEYTIVEDGVPEYTPEVNGFDVTNTHDIEKTEITITKEWFGDSKKDRPEAIKVNVLADGEIIKTVEVTAADGWTRKVTDLPKYAEGQVGVEVAYSIEEIEVNGYITKIEGFNITNTKTPVDNGDPSGPKTGDNMNVIALAGTSLAALLGAIAAIFGRRRRA